MANWPINPLYKNREEFKTVEFSDNNGLFSEYMNGIINNIEYLRQHLVGIDLKPGVITVVTLAPSEPATVEISLTPDVDDTLVIYLNITYGIPAGVQGIQGEKGDKPQHYWNGFQLAFENPDGSIGDYVNLRGEVGPPGSGVAAGLIPIQLTQGDWNGAAAPYSIDIDITALGFQSDDHLLIFTMPYDGTAKVMTYDSPSQDGSTITLTTNKKWSGMVYVCGGIAEAVDLLARQLVATAQQTADDAMALAQSAHTELENKVDKVTGVTNYDEIYIKTAADDQSTISAVDDLPTGNTLPKRTADGNIKTTAAVDDDDAVNKAQLEDIVSTIVENNVIQAQKTLYMTAAGILAETAPTAPVTQSFTVSGTAVSAPVIQNFTATDSGTVGANSTYGYWGNFEGTGAPLLFDTVYTIDIKWRLGTTIIAESVQNIRVQPGESEWSGQIPILANRLSTSLPYIAGAVFTLEFTVQKNTLSTATIDLTSSPDTPTALIRNGGDISSNNVYDTVGGVTLTQSQRNRGYESQLSTLNTKTDLTNTNLLNHTSDTDNPHEATLEQLPGLLAVVKGGTGQTTLPANQVVVGNGTAAVTGRPIATVVGENNPGLVTSEAVNTAISEFLKSTDLVAGDNISLSVGGDGKTVTITANLGTVAPYIRQIAIADWTGSVGNYTFTVANGVHGKGINPTVEMFVNDRKIDNEYHIDQFGTITFMSNINVAITIKIR